MASLAPGNCCAKGFKHTGEAVGKFITLDGIEYYVTGDESLASTKFHLMLSDIIGHRLINAQLLADEYAKTGYFVVIPDLFSGDPALLNPPEGYDVFRDWAPKHVPEITQPIVDQVVKTIQSKWNPTFVVATGFCFGAKYAVRLLATDFVKVSAIFHPSFVTIDEIRAIKGALYIGASEDDYMLTAPLRRQTEDVLLEIKAKYRLTLNFGVEHGFAIRGDISQPWIKYAKERVFGDAVDWFNAVYEIEYKK
ncbi:uncharacterized protein SAPINGB_P004110 [Magnusiomyces paraingens]|uniref:Dienelactone hydrolase domain-containing protein n=1 Tax=Magnusiomyces paraingens TaxID=2606893 RepID=A0A5E8BY83_9ASCO|nr:uncharacterized protein SAPINGB_P004110 [Saprochaete ingens]VVT54507.1 unnamed protein product [Saprochaete ingens]